MLSWRAPVSQPPAPVRRRPERSVVRPASHIGVMGVCGAGKTTIGQALAARLGRPFVDADDFHPPANRAKLAAGVALGDLDRGPWLTALGRRLDAAPQPLVLACSALKASYRTMLGPFVWIWLTGDPLIIQARLQARRGHFMNPELLASQIAELEPPHGCIACDIAEAPDALVDHIMIRLGQS